MQTDKRMPEYGYLRFWFQKQLKSALKPSTVLIGSAYSIFRDGKNAFRGVKREEASFLHWASKNIRDGVCDMVALGRQSLADPLLPAKLQAGKAAEIKWCTACDNCIEFLIRQRPAGRIREAHLKAMPPVRTVLGDREPGTLGFTHSHEHLFVFPVGGVALLDKLLLDDYSRTLQEVVAFREAAGKSTDTG